MNSALTVMAIFALMCLLVVELQIVDVAQANPLIQKPVLPPDDSLPLKFQ
jgi:hypothetical protein